MATRLCTMRWFPTLRASVRLAAISLIGLSAISGVALGQQRGPFAAAPPADLIRVTPIARAIISHNSEELNRLIKEGADVNQRLQGRERERAGFTPLILASALSDVPATQMLIERGAKITILDDYRRSALWYAALNENVPLLAALSKAPGAKEVVNTPDDDLKRTPLHIAVNGDAKDAVQILLILGASESEKIKDVFGETPLDICKDRPTTVCAALR